VGRASPSLLVVTTDPSTIAGFLLPYADHFRRRGWRVDAATGRGDRLGELSAHFDEVHEVPWSRNPRDPRNVTAAPRRVRALIRRGGYDIVHTHTPIASVVTRCALAGLRRRPRVVYTAHGFHFIAGGRPLANWCYATAERAAGRWTDRLVVINDEDAQAAVRLAVMTADKVVAMPGIGIDLDAYAPGAVTDAAAVRSRLGLPGDAVLFTVVAELAPRKNHDTVLRALARSAQPGYHLAFAGEGPRRNALADRIEELGLRGRVHLLGRVTDVRPLVLASAATVLVSRQEGLSRAVLESLSLGVPVIGSTARGVRDLVGPDAGLVVDPDDIDGLCRALDDVQRMPTGGRLRPVLAEQLECYSIGHLLRLHDAMYADLLAS